MQLRQDHKRYHQASVFATGATLASTIRPVCRVQLGRGAGLAFPIIVLPTPTLLHGLHTTPIALAMRATVAVEEAQSVRSVTLDTTPRRGPQRAFAALLAATVPQQASLNQHNVLLEAIQPPRSRRAWCAPRAPTTTALVSWPIWRALAGGLHARRHRAPFTKQGWALTSQSTGW